VQRGAVAQGFFGTRVGSVGMGLAVRAYWHSWSVVATMFSISELSLSYSSRMVLISIAWLGMSSVACLSSASVARVYNSFVGGSAGHWIWRCLGHFTQIGSVR